VIERALSFGRDSGLVGVLTEPGAADAHAPAVLMWNVGIQHRIGPYRIQVDIARELANRGFASLRFDLSGMGDSSPRKDNRPDHERAIDDVREAMALLERRRGARTFVPIGFCSSVDAAHAISIQDPRVVGACFLEGYAFRTRGFWMRYPARLLEARRWARYLESRGRAGGGQGAGRAMSKAEAERATFGSVFERKYPTRKEFGADIRGLVARHVRLLFVYVGGDTDFNHRGQFFEMVGDRSLEDRVDVEYYPHADHTLFNSGDRARAVSHVCQWMSRQFATGSPGAAATR
jgi:hypothetical protein